MKKFDLSALLKKQMNVDFEVPSSYCYFQRSATSRFVLNHLFQKGNAIESIATVTRITDGYKAYISRLSVLNSKLGTPVVIDGEIEQLPYLKWLSIEHVLTEQQMHQLRHNGSSLIGHTRKPSARIASDHYAVSLATGKNYLSVGCVFVSCISAMTTMLTIPPNMFTNPNFEQPIAFVIAAYIMCLSVIMLYASTAYHHTIKRRVARTLLDSVSDTWKEVFSLNSPSDALLMGAIRDALDSVSRLDVVLPDFMSVSPKQAWQILSNISHESGQSIDAQYEGLFEKICKPLKVVDDVFESTSFTMQPNLKEQAPITSPIREQLRNPAH